LSDLFRKEVYQHQARRLAGAVVIASPPGLALLCAVVGVFAVAVVLFLATATYARKELVTGWLVPEGGMIRVQARQGGVVETVLAREGDLVRVGQALATLRLSSDLNGGDSYAALSRSLADQVKSDVARGAVSRDRLEQERGEVVRRQSSLQAELSETRRRLTLQNQRVALAVAEVDRAASIADRGFLPRREVDLRRATALGEEQAASQLRSNIVALERSISEATARLRAIPLDLSEAEAAQLSARAAANQRRVETETQSAYVSTSPVEGIVAALPARQGQALAVGGSIALIRPRGSHLEAELYAPSRAAGFLRPGQKVRLMYQGFPYQKFGAGTGRILSVSRAALAPADIALPTVTANEPMFRIQVALERETVSAYRDSLPLQPGMLLSAEIIIDRRSLLEWLLDPLYAVGRRG